MTVSYGCDDCGTCRYYISEDAHTGCVKHWPAERQDYCRYHEQKDKQAVKETKQ